MAGPFENKQAQGVEFNDACRIVPTSSTALSYQATTHTFTGTLVASSGFSGTTPVGKLDVAGGAAGKAGTATLVAGTKTVSTTGVATGDLIFLSLNTPGGTQGTHYSAPVASITNGTSFVINAVDTSGALVNTDTSTINWWIIDNT
jgi:hypothetical protein